METRICRLHGARDLHIETLPMTGPGPGEVLVALGAAGICGSDLHYWQDGGFGTVRVREPIILGHEAAGTVLALGEGVAGLAPGHRVALNPGHACGTCRFCVAGAAQHCLDMRFKGSAMRMPHEQGMFRDRMVTDLQDATLAVARDTRDDLKTLALALLDRGGMLADKAEVVAEPLVQTDEIGVTTHGLSMIPYYLPDLQAGRMHTTGTETVLRDNRVTLLWDGNYLPGHWLMARALDTCMERVAEFGIAALAMRRSHQIGCLSTVTRIAANRGLVCWIATSDPSGRLVAPFGGTEPTLTPNPWAVGYPGGDHPVLIDTCASITTVSKLREHINSGIRFAHPWMLDGEGHATTDPTVVNADPRGHHPAGGPGRSWPQGLWHGADGRDADDGAGPSWSRRRAFAMGRQRLCAGDRPRGIRRLRGIRARSGVAEHPLSRQPPGARRGPGGRARRPRCRGADPQPPRRHCPARRGLASAATLGVALHRPITVLHQ